MYARDCAIRLVGCRPENLVFYMIQERTFTIWWDIYAEPDPGQQAEQADCMVGGGLEIVLHAAPRPDIARKWEKGLRFGDLRDYIQIGGNFSVVLREGWSREEYEWRDDIPKAYNRMFVYGIGIEANPKEAANPRFMHLDTTLAMRMVIVLSEVPRTCGDCGIEATVVQDKHVRRAPCGAGGRAYAGRAGHMEKDKGRAGEPAF